MNKEFIDALNQLAAERNLDKMQLLTSFEESLEQAYERNVEPGKTIEVEIDPNTGEIDVLVVRRVVEEIEDEDKEILLSEALDLDDTVEVGMEMEFPVDPDKFTRIAVQTTKQVITQKIREAERSIVFEEYKDRAGEVITGIVSRTRQQAQRLRGLGPRRGYHAAKRADSRRALHDWDAHQSVRDERRAVEPRAEHFGVSSRARVAPIPHAPRNSRGRRRHRRTQGGRA